MPRKFTIKKGRKKMINIKRTRKQRQKQRGGLPPAPTKEKLLKVLGVWSSISCLPHNKGMVTVVENSEDTKGITVCRVFEIDETIKVDKLYQYILYRDGETIKILITPGFESPEVGTKHRCLLQRVPDKSLVLASGELLKRGSTVYYSCMSSLFFQVMKNILFPDRATRNEEIKQYEEVTVGGFMRDVVPYGDEVIYVKNIEPSGFSIGVGGTEVYTEPYEKLLFNPERFCEMPEEERPSCLRYVQKEDCEILQNHPAGGYCEAGVDFCANKDMELPPKMEVPEEAYVYDHKSDYAKANSFLKERGINIPGNNLMGFARAKQIAKREGLSDTQIKDSFYTKTKVWPR
jgi:hypothetical protein